MSANSLEDHKTYGKHTVAYRQVAACLSQLSVFVSASYYGFASVSP